MTPEKGEQSEIHLAAVSHPTQMIKTAFTFDEVEPVPFLFLFLLVFLNFWQFLNNLILTFTPAAAVTGLQHPRGYCCIFYYFI